MPQSRDGPTHFDRIRLAHRTIMNNVIYDNDIVMNPIAGLPIIESKRICAIVKSLVDNRLPYHCANNRGQKPQYDKLGGKPGYALDGR